MSVSGSPRPDPGQNMSCGWLEMKSRDEHVWELKWVKLNDNQTSYYVMENGKVEGDFIAVHIQELTSTKNAFVVYASDNQTYEFKAESRLLMRHWIEKFQEAIQAGDTGAHYWDRISKWNGCPPSKRRGASSVLLGDQAYFFGGLGAHYCYNDMYQFHLPDSSWKLLTTAASPAPRYNHSATLLPGKDGESICMYILGGEDTSQVFGDLHCFDFHAVNHQWQKIVPYGHAPVSLTEHTACASGDTMYVFGGHKATPGSKSRTLQQDFLTFRAHPPKFDVVQPRVGSVCPEPRRGHSCALSDDTMFIFGGIGQNDNYLSSMFAFDIRNRMWYLVRVAGWDTVPARIAFHVSHAEQWDMAPGDEGNQVLNRSMSSSNPPSKHSKMRTSLYVFGGKRDHQEDKKASNTLLRVRVAGHRGGVWGEVACFHSPAPSASSSSFIWEGRLFVFGGETEGGKMSNEMHCLDLNKVENVMPEEYVSDGDDEIPMSYQYQTHTPDEPHTPTGGVGEDPDFDDDELEDSPDSAYLDNPSLLSPDEEKNHLLDIETIMGQIQSDIDDQGRKSPVELLEDNLIKWNKRNGDSFQVGPTRPKQAERSKSYNQLKQAQNLIAKKEYKKAMNVLQEAMNVSFFDALLHYNMGCCCALMGNADEAVGHLQIAVNCGFNSISSLLEDEDLVSIRNKVSFQDLIREMKNRKRVGAKGPEDLLPREQDKIDELMMKAEIKLRAEEYAAAVALFRQARCICPRHAIVSYNLACAYSLMNNRAMALQALEDALSQGFDKFEDMLEDPDLANVRKTLEWKSLYNRIQLNQRGGSAKRNGSVHAHCDEEASSSCGNKTTSGSGSKGMLGLVDSAQADDDSDTHNYEREAESLIRKGAYKAALRTLRLAQAANPRPSVFYNMCCVHSLLNNKKKALGSLSKAVEMGFLELSLLDEDADLENMRLHPDFIRIKADIQKRIFHATLNDQIAKSVQLLRNGDLDSALDVLLDSEISDPENASIHARLAYCYGMVDKPHIAKQYTQRALIFGLNSYHVHHIAKELSEAMNSDYCKTKLACQEEVMMKQITILVSDMLIRGVDQMKAENYSAAEAILKAAAVKKDDENLIYYNLACVHSIIKRPELALDAMRCAIERGFLDIQAIDEDSDLEQMRMHADYPKLQAMIADQLRLARDMKAAETPDPKSPASPAQTAQWALKSVSSKAKDTMGSALHGMARAVGRVESEESVTIPSAPRHPSLVSQWRDPSSVWGVSVRDDLVATVSKRVRIWQLPSGQPTGDLKSLETDLPGNHARTVEFLHLNGTQYLAVGTQSMVIKLMDFEVPNPTIVTFKDPSIPEGPGNVKCIKAIGTSIISSGHDQTIKLWDVQTQQCTSTFRGHTNSVRGLSVYNAHMFYSASRDGTVRCWDIRSPKPTQTLEGHPGGASCVNFIAGKEMVVSGTGDGPLYMWPITQVVRPLRTLYGHTQKVRSLSSLEWLLASGSDDHTVRLWSLQSAECCDVLEEHTGWVTGLGSCPKRSSFISTGRDSVINVWSIKNYQSNPKFRGQSLVSQTVLQDPLKLAHKKEKEATLWKERYYDLICKRAAEKEMDNMLSSESMAMGLGSTSSSTATAQLALAHQQISEWKTRYEVLLKQHEEQTLALREKYQTASAANVDLEQQLALQCKERSQQSQIIKRVKEEGEEAKQIQSQEIYRLSTLIRDISILSTMRTKDFDEVSKLSTSLSHHVLLIRPKGSMSQALSNTQYVLKVDLNPNRSKDRTIQDVMMPNGGLMHEILLLHALPKQRNIVSLYSHFEDEYHYTDAKDRPFRKKGAMMAVQQLLHTSLETVIESSDLNLTTCLCLLEELLELLLLLHDHQIVHTNLSPKSIYVDDKQHLVLGQFTHAIKLEQSMSMSTRELAQLWHGPYELMPPEVSNICKEEEDATIPETIELSTAEVWCAGRIACLILRLPARENDKSDQTINVLESPFLSSVGVSSVDTLSKTGTSSATSRSQHSARILQELLVGMLQPSPSERLSPPKALKHFKRLFSKGNFMS